MLPYHLAVRGSDHLNSNWKCCTRHAMKHSCLTIHKRYTLLVHSLELYVQEGYGSLFLASMIILIQGKTGIALSINKLSSTAHCICFLHAGMESLSPSKIMFKSLKLNLTLRNYCQGKARTWHSPLIHVDSFDAEGRSAGTANTTGRDMYHLVQYRVSTLYAQSVQ